MKKLSYIILGFIVGALATYYFCPRQVDDGIDDIKFVKPKGVISPDQAKTLNNNWTMYRKAAVDSAASMQGRKVDNRSTWWSLDDIQNYITFAKHESDSLGYSMTGIRVYLGVYGENAGQDKKDYTTMFMVPTAKKGTDRASMNPFAFQGDEEDCPECSPLNDGGNGYPPGAPYPN